MEASSPRFTSPGPSGAVQEPAAQSALLTAHAQPPRGAQPRSAAVSLQHTRPPAMHLGREGGRAELGTAGGKIGRSARHPPKILSDHSGVDDALPRGATQLHGRTRQCTR